MFYVRFKYFHPSRIGKWEKQHDLLQSFSINFGLEMLCTPQFSSSTDHKKPLLTLESESVTITGSKAFQDWGLSACSISCRV